MAAHSGTFISCTTPTWASEDADGDFCNITPLFSVTQKFFLALNFLIPGFLSPDLYQCLQALTDSRLRGKCPETKKHSSAHPAHWIITVKNHIHWQRWAKSWKKDNGVHWSKKSISAQISESWGSCLQWENNKLHVLNYIFLCREICGLRRAR